MKNFKNYFLSIFLILLISAIIPFILGQVILYISNYIHSGTVPTKHFIVNTIVVSIEIASSILLIMALHLTFKKDIWVYIIYFMIVFVLMISNNVYISMPLSINLLAADGQGYYVTFGLPLWIGRIFIISIFAMFFNYSITRFIRKYEEQ
ncbi:hypothetical protein [Oceanirhabdus sp. W0125-5]|uniref:hypothetical protein n=1 Tax=Oceanirhabdus sp. W0125-5 TaxID=2999116 RepID=UPI0022F2A9B0|nr:hypothetical protein [Oceanirhabdus sp. W0125-5]WBW97754.1 hypothetical protein OW730_02945 [Oceanirhabdus sp. W0125-5]